MGSGAKSRGDATSAGLHADGLDVAPGVLETIVTLAAQDVDGVECVDGTGLAGLMQKAGVSKPVEVASSEDGALAVTIRMTVRHGRPLHAVAADVQSAVADALTSQTGRDVSGVDVWIDAIVFPPV